MDIAEAWIGIAKIITAIIWATYRLIVPAEERSVARDLVLVRILALPIHNFGN